MDKEELLTLSQYPKPPQYVYRCKVVKIVDGDTQDVDIDLGFNITIRRRLRLYGINTWEIRGAEREKGLAAKKFVENFVADAKEIWLQTLMDAEGKYGRILAILWSVDPGEFPGHKCLNTELLRLEHGREYMIGEKGRRL